MPKPLQAKTITEAISLMSPKKSVPKAKFRKITPYQFHVATWENCEDCELCTRRKKVVLGKGKLPCDVLFVGEAPGASEDVFGVPFVGPAGALLQDMVSKASGDLDVRIAYTNLVACIPKGEDGDKIAEPEFEWIKACSGRLTEFINIASPRLIICVGKLAAKYVPQLVEIPIIEIIHPAAILRGDASVKGLLIQRTLVTIADALSEVML